MKVFGPEIAHSKGYVTASNKIDSEIITQIYDFIFNFIVDSVYFGFGGLYSREKVVPKTKIKTKKQQQQKIKKDNLK